MSGQYLGGDDELEQAILSALTLAEVAKMFSISRITLDYWRARHDFPAFKIGVHVLVDSNKLEAWALRKKKLLPKVALYLANRGGKVDLGRRRVKQRTGIQYISPLRRRERPRLTA